MPIIIGLAFQRIPYGSPGMKINSQKSNPHDYESYAVFSFIKSGEIKIFEKIYPKKI